ncbi:hypothetical protein M2272_004646 [Mycobacterium frederiksbergense]|uniref:Secreted protein n=1 Tax=Mycolicibacterium frederiksbergense TaxID=117567 RepID=A0ABT6L7N0_9MYCO|nr:hypothetical protein [Mycolicibacterium frederiksbergense]MDH6197990.1 hypothetical protein [Mycolicibacterium frederiksbergense]
MMCGRVSGWSRGAAALAVLAAAAVPSPGPAGADLGATAVVTVVAVANGEPVNGYHVINRQPSPNLSTCPGPSPAATADDIYACEPSQAMAQVCWPTPGSVLCLVDPWSKELRRFPAPGALPAVGPPGTPMPFALLLEDGTSCVLAGGVDWGGRRDGLVPAYVCDPRVISRGVLIDPGQDLVSAIDRSQQPWAVQVGGLGARGTSFEPPRRYTVSTAWFAGN